MDAPEVYCEAVMEMVVYLDSVFIINTLVNYFLLRLTARLMSCAAPRFRCALGAAVGGAYAVSVFLMGNGWQEEWIIKLALGVLLCLIAFGRETQFFKLTVLFLALSCALAGCVLAMNLLGAGSVIKEGVYYFDADWRVFLAAAGLIYALLRLLFAKSISHGARGEIAEAKLFHKGRSVSFRVLCDTGNTLRDPITGRQVLLADKTAVGKLLTEEERFLLGREALSPVELLEKLSRGGRHGFFLLPYRAVGVEKGMLLALRCERAEIGGKRYTGLPVGIMPAKIHGEGNYEGLWGRNE